MFVQTSIGYVSGLKRGNSLKSREHKFYFRTYVLFIVKMPPNYLIAIKAAMLFLYPFSEIGVIIYLKYFGFHVFLCIQLGRTALSESLTRILNNRVGIRRRGDEGYGWREYHSRLYSGG